MFKHLGAAVLVSAAMGVAPQIAHAGPEVVRQVAPEYPRGAERRKIEGFVVVEFTVQPDGSVNDVAVVNAEPAGVFDSAAVKAVGRWKYKKLDAAESIKTKIAFQLQ